MRVDIECWGKTPEDIVEMAFREAEKFLQAARTDLECHIFAVHPRHRSADGSVSEWEADVTVSIKEVFDEVPQGEGEQD